MGRYRGAMIERYTLPEMGRVWSEAHKYELWCRVEVLVLEAHARAGTVPAESVEPVRSALPPTPEAVAAVEAVTDHDVIAFLTAWADNTDAALGRRLGALRDDLLRPARHRARGPAGRGERPARWPRPPGWSRRCAITRWRTGTRCGRAGRTASTPNPTPGGTGWPTSPSPWPAAGTGSSGPGTRWRSARCPARSAATPTSTRPSRPRSCPRSGCAPRTWPPRS